MSRRQPLASPGERQYRVFCGRGGRRDRWRRDHIQGLELARRTAQGVIIVRNGNLSMANAGGLTNSGFEGVVIVIGDGGVDGDNDGRYSQIGRFTLDGYVAAS